MSGVNVYNEANDKIGEISDVIITEQGQVKGVVIEAGGFLGMGKHYVLVAINSLKFSNEAGKTSSGKTICLLPFLTIDKLLLHQKYFHA